MLLFYDEPVALNREIHKGLRFTALPDFRFSAATNSVPLAGIEFFEAGRDLPVLFGHDVQGGYFPLALLALRADGHGWCDEAGAWRGSYVPAFIRRYPFALTPEGNVCFDNKAAALSSGQGEPLFTEAGDNAPALERVLRYLRQFDGEYRRTREFCAALGQQDLFRPFPLQVMQQGQPPLRLQGLFVLDEKKVAELPDALVTDWFRKGWLGWLFAHLHSLSNLERLNRELNKTPN